MILSCRLTALCLSLSPFPLYFLPLASVTTQCLAFCHLSPILAIYKMSLSWLHPTMELLVNSAAKRPKLDAVGGHPYGAHAGWGTHTGLTRVGAPIRGSRRLGHPYGAHAGWGTHTGLTQVGAPIRGSRGLGHPYGAHAGWGTHTGLMLRAKGKKRKDLNNRAVFKK
jgi:hypothetical protein